MPEPPSTPYTGYAPHDGDPTRIAPLAVLPVFFKLRGRRVVLAGGSAGAAWKTELLAACGASVDVYAPEPSDEMLEIVAVHPGRVLLHSRPWSIEVMAGAAMAVGAIEDEAEGQAFRCAARFTGVPVNVVDRPRFCDFSFGAIVNRSPLVIGISTDGAAPVLGQAVRGRIDALLPIGFQRWAEAARDWRAAVKASGLGFVARRDFWRIFTGFAVANPQAEPQPGQRDLWLGEAGQAKLQPELGSLAFLALGTGDPELLTMKAVRLLQSADVIVCDRSAPAGILDLARREARKLVLGEEDNAAATLVALAKSGQRVVRLGAAAPEIAVLDASGIPTETVTCGTS